MASLGSAYRSYASDNQAHYNECDRLLGVNQYDDLDQSLRWPGYVGQDWQPGRGVLFIGSVHSDFRGDRSRGADRTPIVRDLADANRTWRGLSEPDNSDDATYLEATRLAYGQLIPWWPRGSQFSKLLHSLFPDAGDVYAHAAWTNLAHCRSKPRNVSEYPLQFACSGRNGQFPLGELIGILWPAAIVCSVKPFDGAYRSRFSVVPRSPAITKPGGYEPPILRAFDGRNGRWCDQDADTWLTELGHQIRERWARNLS